MPVVYGENERAFERLQEELLRTSSDDSIFAFDIAKKIAQVDGQRTTTLLATSPSDFADCGDIVYLGHKAGTEHEVFTKQINFTLTTTTEAKDLHKKHGDWRWFFDFVTFLVLFPILAPIMVISGALNGSRPMTAFLNCRRTNTPEVMLGLCLVPQVRGRRQTAFFVEPFFVQGIAHRVATYNLYGRRYVGGRQKTFSVIRTPGMVHANTRHSLAVICSSRTAHTLLTPISSKPKCVMLAREEAATVFTIPTIPPNMHSDLNVELEVRMHDRKVAQVHMDMRPSRWRFIQLRVQGRALHLPDWTTWALFKDAYSSSIKWHKGGFLIVRGFATRVPFTRKDVLLLECEHVGGLTRLTYLIGRRLIVSVPSILLLALPAMIFGAALYSVVSKSRLFLLASIPVGVASIAFYRQLDNWRRAEWL